MPLKVENTHPHGKDCKNFADALKWGIIIIIEGEPQIAGKMPEGVKAGNVITGEKYDPATFGMNMVITHCPFCGIKIFELKKEEES